MGDPVQSLSKTVHPEVAGPKLQQSRCTYCGQSAETVDHLIPRLRHGPDSADNLVPACRWCNSSKGGRDVFEWATSKGFFPLAVIRRYLVLAWRWTERAQLLDAPVKALRASNPPFRVGDIPWASGTPVMLKRHRQLSARSKGSNRRYRLGLRLAARPPRTGRHGES